MVEPAPRARIDGLGFRGFQTVATLHKDRCMLLPALSGVYVVLRPGAAPPTFLGGSAGGWFKGKDPTVTTDELEARWLDSTPVLYIGMAGTSLRQRVRALVDYGGGRPVGHQGGRYLWQVEGSGALLVGWRTVDEARAAEAHLLADFEQAHGQLPFANLNR